MPDRAPTIGIFDSGVGGLTVAAAIHRRLPSHPLRYLGDTAWFPYGALSDAEIEQRSLVLAGWLAEAGCSLMVVACNSASSAALETLRARLELPVVGMEPPLKPAVERSRSGRVVVLVTPATARGRRLERLHDAHAHGAEVETVPMPGLAALVEAGEIDGPRIEAMLGEALRGPLERGADAIALGCTHYGFLRGAVQRLATARIEVIDAAEAVARRVEQLLGEHGIEAPTGLETDVTYSATGDTAAFAGVVARLRAAGADLPPLRLDPLPRDALTGALA